ncbi:MAG: hypothetical protein A2X23_12535 [Chloroflexi bacterium GWC2_73_18]|nr:MAG: hypothetical protein A2X23_12535 [Chloroflexi bacterium GWC2_73_18]
MRRVGVDTGGTFTDCVLVDEATGDLAVAKVPSQPGHPERAVAAGLTRLLAAAAIKPGDVGFVAHGTTVATNAVITGQLARAGLITGEGSRDVLEIGTQMRPRLYALTQPPRPSLIPRDRRVEVPGRLAFDGTELDGIDEARTREAALRLVEAGVESIAIACLFSYVDPRHEERIERIVRDCAPGLYVARSSAVCPEMREYPRFATTAINAVLAPLLDRYIGGLSGILEREGVHAALFVMQSNGGIGTAARSVARNAHRLILSGPAAGVLGGAAVAAAAGLRDVVTLDMGGTSADIGIVPGHVPRTRLGMTLADVLPLQIPALEVEAIGAGGGSIAWVDPGGALHVGPASAGAAPGPACYGLGGTEPTVSDAHVVLGRLDPASFLGGELTLDTGAARAGCALVAERLGCSVEAAARGILAVAEANMVGAIRRAAARHGDDLREFALVAAGGAGPLHGVALARALGIQTVCVPPRPGLLSALGLLAADLRNDLSRALLMFADRPDPVAVEAIFDELEIEAHRLLDEDGIAPAARRLERGLDLRYVGQEWSLTVPISAGEPMTRIVGRFHELHERTYGHAAPEERVETVSARLIAWGILPRPAIRASPPGARPPGARVRDVWFDGAGGAVRTTILRRDDLVAGATFAGPAIVEQLDSTTAVPPGATARVDPSGALLIEVG